MTKEMLLQGITALRQGDKENARHLLTQVVKRDPKSVQGWMWLSGAVESEEARRYCMGQILAIQPDNSQAKTGLKKLGPGLIVSPFPQNTETKPMKETTQSVSFAPISSAHSTKPTKPIRDKKPKKKSRGFGWIILILIIAGGLFYFFNLSRYSIIGTWEYTGTDSVEIYTFHFYGCVFGKLRIDRLAV